MALFECAANDRDRSISVPLVHADCAARLHRQSERVSDSATSEQAAEEEQTRNRQQQQANKQ
jgi:hypothetical protein